jgi:hypothetical protein
LPIPQKLGKHLVGAGILYEGRYTSQTTIWCFIRVLSSFSNREVLASGTRSVERVLLPFAIVGQHIDAKHT